VINELAEAGVSASVIGNVTSTPVISISVDGHECVKGSTMELRDMWEETSFNLEMLQRLKSCVEAEQMGLKYRSAPQWKLPFIPTKTAENVLASKVKPKVAILREEGSNGDREMSAMAHAAGFEPWDISMSDLLSEKISLEEFRGLVFVGGFSYADVLDSGKGWAGSIRFNDALLKQVCC
jgi:phosphoribosylformylglycinamidine synthase